MCVCVHIRAHAHAQKHRGVSLLLTLCAVRLVFGPTVFNASQFCFRLEQLFLKRLGPSCLEKLGQQVTAKPMLLIAGDQLTGKSTLGLNVAKASGAKFWSVGSAFRDAAAKRGVSIGEFSRHLLENGSGDVDVEIDYRTCEMIAGRNFDGAVGVIEGRQPAFMALFLRERFHKQRTLSVYLQCDLRERALRFLLREFGGEAQAIGDRLLPRGGESIAAFTRHIAALPLPNIARVAEAFADNQNRDETDADRYNKLYGIDYRDRRAYDIVIDTSGRTGEENWGQLRNALLQHHDGTVFIEGLR